MVNRLEVYKAYIKAKSEPQTRISDVAKSFKITRNALYAIVREIETGNERMVAKCTAKTRLECIWEYRYKPKFLALEIGRQKETVSLLKEIIIGMKHDGFNTAQISRLVERDRATVLHHLKNVSKTTKPKQSK